MRRYGDMLRMQNSRVAERRATLTCVSLTCPVLVVFLIFTVMGVCMRIPCLFNMWDRELADTTRHTAQVVICQWWVHAVVVLSPFLAVQKCSTHSHKAHATKQPSLLYQTYIPTTKPTQLLSMPHTHISVEVAMSLWIRLHNHTCRHTYACNITTSTLAVQNQRSDAGPDHTGPAHSGNTSLHSPSAPTPIGSCISQRKNAP